MRWAIESWNGDQALRYFASYQHYDNLQQFFDVNSFTYEMRPILHIIARLLRSYLLRLEVLASILLVASFWVYLKWITERLALHLIATLEYVFIITARFNFTFFDA